MLSFRACCPSPARRIGRFSSGGVATNKGLTSRLAKRKVFFLGVRNAKVLNTKGAAPAQSPRPPLCKTPPSAPHAVAHITGASPSSLFVRHHCRAFAPPPSCARAPMFWGGESNSPARVE
eukprot:1178322-Prorocentrum_minimum.AAC.5